MVLMKRIHLVPYLFLFLFIVPAVQLSGVKAALVDEVLASPNREVITLEPAGNELKFTTTEIRAKAGTELTLKLANKSTLMPHSILVLAGPDQVEEIGQAAMQAAETDFVPQGFKDSIIANTKVAQPGETVEVTFTVPPAGSYPFICPYPGHFTMMRGVLISE